jgi:hypothetical protein
MAPAERMISFDALAMKSEVPAYTSGYKERLKKGPHTILELHTFERDWASTSRFIHEPRHLCME